MFNKPDLSIIIVNYNTRELILRCLSSIERSDLNGLSLEIIVVDNASSDKSVAALSDKKITLISNSENIGFSKANNQAIKKAHGEYILLLNPDTEVMSETFKTMIEYMRNNKEVGISTCNVELKKNGLLDDASHRGFPTPWNAFCHFSGISNFFPKSRILNGYHLGYQNLDQIHEIDSCVGAFMLVKKEVGDSVGWFDEDYYWYGEDLDFCYKVKQKGWKVMFVPLTKIIHWKGASSGIREETKNVSNASLETRIKASTASTQAMRIFYRKHYLKKYPSIITSLILFGINILEKRRIKKIRENFN